MPPRPPGPRPHLEPEPSAANPARVRDPPQSAPASPVAGRRCAAETATRTDRSRAVPHPKTGPRRWPDQRISPGRVTWMSFSAPTEDHPTSGRTKTGPAADAEHLTETGRVPLGICQGRTGFRHPQVPLTREIGEFGTPLSIGRAKQVLGYEPRHSWRDHPVSCSAPNEACGLHASEDERSVGHRPQRRAGMRARQAGTAQLSAGAAMGSAGSGIRSRVARYSRSTKIHSSTDEVTCTQTRPAGRWLKYCV